MIHILNYLEGQKGKQLEELFEFIRFESISSEPDKAEVIRNTANWLCEHIKSIGFEKVEICETGGHPLVYAEWLNAGEDKPTLLIYGHYDVQPVDPIELWVNPPFEPTIQNNKIYARGSSDDKGQVFAHLKALEAHFRSKGKLPINVKLLIEGEEEIGSKNLGQFVSEHLEMLKCDTIVISDTEWFADGVPSLCYALRGISYLEVKVTGPNKDLHSGTYGGAVDNPIQVLAWIINQLKDKYGRITVPGFYDDVLQVTEFERDNFKKLPFSEKEYCNELGLDLTAGEIGYSTIERTWIRPSLDVNGIKGGYIGEGAKTVLPSEASAKISVRLVPNQEPIDIYNKIEQYLRSIAPPTVKIEVQYLHGGEPVLAPIDNKGIRAAMKAMESAFGIEPVFMSEGGSIPIVALFAKLLNSPPVLMGLGLPGDNIHSPNENFDLTNFEKGIRAAALFYSLLAEQE